MKTYKLTASQLRKIVSLAANKAVAREAATILDLANDIADKSIEMDNRFRRIHKKIGDDDRKAIWKYIKIIEHTAPKLVDTVEDL